LKKNLSNQSIPFAIPWFSSFLETLWMAECTMGANFCGVWYPVGISCIFGKRKNKNQSRCLSAFRKARWPWVPHWLVCLAWAFIPINSADRGGFTLHIIIKQQQQHTQKKKESLPPPTHPGPSPFSKKINKFLLTKINK